MDETNPDSWFEHEFGPYCGVADYANEPPRGMTNPPMNRALRVILCEDLQEYGLQLTVPSWGGGFGRPMSVGRASSPATPSRSVSSPVLRCRSAMMSGYSENLRQGRVLKRGSIFTQSAAELHSSLPGGCQEVVKEEGEEEHEEEKEEEEPEPKIEAKEKADPKISTYCKRPRNTFCAIPRKTGNSKKKTDAKKDGAKDEEGTHKVKVSTDEGELGNRMRGLRGNSQLHRAAVKDKFKFGASSSAGEPMVLGASCLNQANPGSWSSDASALNKFHNSSIRIVDPSGLKVLPLVTNEKKKKKKDEDEQLTMGSGLFVARYPINPALVDLRKVRKQAYPPEVKKYASVAEEVAATAQDTKLKFGLSGISLNEVREHDAENKQQQAEAMAKSGY